MDDDNDAILDELRSTQAQPPDYVREAGYGAFMTPWRRRYRRARPWLVIAGLLLLAFVSGAPKWAGG